METLIAAAMITSEPRRRPPPSPAPSNVKDDDDGYEPPMWWAARQRQEEKEAMLAAGGHVCAKSKCNRVVPADDDRNTCQMCRDRAQRYIESGAQAAAQRKYRKTEAGRATAQRVREGQKANGNKAASDRRQVENGNKARRNKRQVENGNRAASNKRRTESGVQAAAQRKYRKTEVGQASVQRDREAQKANGNKAANDAKYKKTEKGKANNKRQNSKFSNILVRSLQKTLVGKHTWTEPMTFKSYGIHHTEKRLRAHFDAHFDRTWMTRDNYGRHEKGLPPKTRWQIGHRIAKSEYDHTDPEEVQKCWSLANLFPQCAKENNDQGKKYLPPMEVLLMLRPIWPKKWNGQLSSRLVDLESSGVSSGSSNDESE